MSRFITSQNQADNEALPRGCPKLHYDGLTFMQDNILIHTAHKVRDWFKENENGIETTHWPPYFPDLNPIEHAWHALKVLTAKIFPEVMNASWGFGGG